MTKHIYNERQTSVIKVKFDCLGKKIYVMQIFNMVVYIFKHLQ